MKVVVVGGSTFSLKYDDTYHFYRPPRAHHCSDTHVVVEQFDHFCPWVGQTIGLRNYCAFVRFLASAFVLLLSTTGFCVLRIVQHARRAGASSQTLLDTALEVVAAPLIILYCIGALLPAPRRSARLPCPCALAALHMIGLVPQGGPSGE